MNTKPWRIPSNATKVFEGKKYIVWQWEQKLYDGSTTIFEGLERKKDSTNIIGIMPDGQILLVKDEQPDRSAVITPAGGQVEPGETPEQAAQREFQEETGHTVGSLRLWHQFQPYPRVQWTVHSFIGTNITQVGAQNPDSGEKITNLFFSFEDFLKLGFDNQLRDPYLRIRLIEAYYDDTKRNTLKQELYGI